MPSFATPAQISACGFYHLKRFCAKIFNFLFTHAFYVLLKAWQKISSIHSITGTFSTQ